MKKFQKKYLINKRGFTLVELLVVVSIISLLSSVVFASVSAAKSKTQDAVIISDMEQIENLLALEYSDQKNYDSLQNGLWHYDSTYSGNYDSAIYYLGGGGGNIYSSSKYGDQVARLARDIIKNNINHIPGYHGAFYLSSELTYPTHTPGVQKYSMAAYLPDRQGWYCVGSSGKTFNVSSWEDTGCFNNP